MPSDHPTQPAPSHVPSEAEIAAVVTAHTGYTATPEELRILSARLQFVQPQLDRLRAEALGETEPWHGPTVDLDGGTPR